MKKFTFLIFCSILLLLLQTELKAQVYQLPNGGFELWDGGTNDEPTYWNGFPSGACDLSGLAALGCSTAKTKRHQKTTDIRPGSSGTYSCKIFATSFGSIIANGNITTGQIRIGSTTPSNSGNYNITRTGDSNFNQAINAKPDSIVFWAKLVCPSATQEARINVVIHDSYDFRDPSTSDASASSHIVGQATCNFARGSQDWIRYSVPFDYNGYTATTPEYILISFTTNVVPGEGSVNDNLFIDDVELVYNVNLQNIFADGTGIENFDPDVTDYYYDADCNYLSNLISAVAVSPNANVDVVQATENNPVAIITVTSGDKSKEYNVHFLNYMSEETYIYEAICETEPYGFFGQELSEENIYRHTLQNIYGCDSVIVLTLTVNPVYETPENAAICEGDTYDFFGTELTEANIYRHTLQSMESCDSVIVLTLTVNPVYETPESASICEGDTYDFFGTELTEANTYRHTLQSMESCDSVVVLTLTVNPVYETPESAAICEGDTYDFFGTELTEANTYRHTLRSMEGCDSVIVFTLTVNPVYETPESATICEGDTYDFFGTILTEANTYRHTLQSMESCDSVIVLTLTVNPVTYNTINPTSCGTYLAPDETQYSESGIYTAIIENVYGCDSIITINLTVNPNPSPTVSDIADVTECSGTEIPMISFSGDIDETVFYWTVSGNAIGLENGNSNTGIPAFTPIIPQNGPGAEVIVRVTPKHTYDNVTCEGNWKEFSITVNPVYETPESAAICEGGTYDFFGTELTEANTYRHTLQSVEGCDSVIVLTLTVNPVYETPESAAICEGGTYDFFGTELTEANTYRHTLQSVEGCDSVIVLTLTVNPVYETPESAAICEGDTYDFFGTELTEANTYRHTLQSVEGCDSVIVFTLTVNSVDVSVTFYTLEGNALSAVAENAQYQWLDCNNDYSEIEGATDRIFSPVQSGDYAVEITQNDCTDISECQNVIITEIISNEFENKVKVYPNPTKGNITIDLGEQNENVTINIYDSAGKQIKNLESYGESIINLEITGFAGSYYVEIIKNNGDKVNFKIVKTE